MVKHECHPNRSGCCWHETGRSFKAQRHIDTKPARVNTAEMKGIGIVGNVVKDFYLRISSWVIICLSNKLCKIYLQSKVAPQFKFKLNKIQIKTFKFHPVTQVSKMIFKVNVAALMGFAINLLFSFL